MIPKSSSQSKLSQKAMPSTALDGIALIKSMKKVFGNLWTNSKFCIHIFVGKSRNRFNITKYKQTLVKICPVLWVKTRSEPLDLSRNLEIDRYRRIEVSIVPSAPRLKGFKFKPVYKWSLRSNTVFVDPPFSLKLFFWKITNSEITETPELPRRGLMD